MERKIVCVRLVGGLGNQLFAYAYGRCLAAQLNRSLLIDDQTGFYRDSYKRRPRVQSFLRNYYKVSKRNILIFYFAKLFKKVSSILLKTYHLKELDPRAMVIPDIERLENSNTIFCEGYFQSYRYFQDHESLLRKEISLKHISSDVLSALSAKIRETNSVALHIRRVAYDSLLDISYYKKAVGVLTKKIDNPVFFLFSDDIEWCRENFGFLSDKFFIDIPNGDEVTDLFLMSSCKHFVIANSSFSWWGAWLSNSPNKFIIAPSQTNIGVKDAFYPKDWILI